jgi:hypothetical protein
MRELVQQVDRIANLIASATIRVALAAATAWRGACGLAVERAVLHAP